ncbi:MAG: helix-turn-helix domain-containing protein [Bacillota bacterium]
MSKQYLSLIERDRIKNPSTAMLNKLAMEFGVTVDFLISGIEGNKDNFLNSKNSLQKSIQACREKIELKDTGNNNTPFIYKKAENLLDLFEVICSLQFNNSENYDFYTESLNKLIKFIECMMILFEGENIESGLEIIIDQTFWKIGNVMREFAVRMDQKGETVLHPGELTRVTAIVEEMLERLNKGKDVPLMTKEINLQGARLNLTYYGFLNIPEEYWDDFRKRVIFEWEMIMQKVKKKYS